MWWMSVALAGPVEELEAYAFPEQSQNDIEERLGVRTDGLLIVQGGEVVYERYANGYGADTPHLLWSATKTFTNVLIGLAVSDGRLAIEDSICDYVSVPHPEHCDIRVVDLLEFSSGLDWRETYEGDPPTTSTVIAMLYGAGRDDMAAYVAGTPRRTEPGGTWQYSSGDTNLLAAVVQAAMEPTHGADFAWTMLFEPLGMESVVWERDAAGTMIGSSYGYATPRDLARFGEFLLNEGEGMLPEGWVHDSVQVAPSIRASTVDRDPFDTNGRQIWVNLPVPEQGEVGPPLPSAPLDTYSARGHWKQGLFVIPSEDLVIVRTGDDRDGSFSWDELLRLSLAVAAVEVEPAPAGAGGVTAANTSSLSRDEEMGLLGLGTGYGSKMACSCRYVMGMDEDFCRAWVKASPDIVKIRFSDEDKTATAKAVGMKKTSASWQGERGGCTHDP